MRPQNGASITVEIMKACRQEAKSVSDLRDITGVAYATVHTYTEAMADLGVLQRSKRTGRTGRPTSEFRLTEAWKGGMR